MAQVNLPDIMEVIKFPDSVQISREVRLAEDKGYVMLIKDPDGNELYNFYDKEGMLRKQQSNLKNPGSVERAFIQRPNIASLDFCLALIKAVEAYRVKYNQMLDMLSLQAETLRQMNNNN